MAAVVFTPARVAAAFAGVLRGAGGCLCYAGRGYYGGGYRGGYYGGGYRRWVPGYRLGTPFCLAYPYDPRCMVAGYYAY